jgi:hypothetical protein
MKIFKGCGLVCALAFAIPCAVSAQGMSQGSMAHPKILQITREYVKPGKAGELHDKAESAFVRAMERAKWPTHYLGMTSLSGKQRALFFTWYESLDAWQKDTAATDKNAMLSAELERAAEADGELLDSMDQGVFLFNEEQSLRPLADLSHMKFMEILLFHVRPGHSKEWDEIVKLVKGAYEKSDPTAHWGEYDLMYGGESDTHIVLTAHPNLAEVDEGMKKQKDFVAAMGEDGMKKLDELSASAIDLSQSQLFAFDPHMSYVSEDWIKADPEFWKPKEMMHKEKMEKEMKKPTE